MKAKITANKKFIVGEIDKRIYGSFIEHLGRAVYTGIYEPTHPDADELGFRKDVLELVKQIDVPIVRYPGGNFVSGYKWEDGVGDKSKRPKKVDLAWETIETNEFGTDEFQEWTKRANSEVMMAVNLGTRGAADAQNLLEYCNLDTDSYYANMRRENGFEKPFGIKTWCLGNEMDGPWQMGYKSAEDYGKLCLEVANIMKMTDPTIELVACGSSNYNMPTFGDWEYKVLDHAYDKVDYISLHQYYGDRFDGPEDLLGKSVHLDMFIKSVAAICDAVKAKKHSEKTVNLSLDEWNVWYHSNSLARPKWIKAPAIIEEDYNLLDALLVGCMLMTIQNNCDRVKIACMAQLVNVIAPITTEVGGRAWARTIYYPYMYASRYGRGEVLKTVNECGFYEKGYKVPYLESSVVYNKEKNEIVVFAVNRSLDEEMELDVCFENFENCKLKEHILLNYEDIYATNSADEQTVAPCVKKASDNGKIVLEKHSWNMLRFTCEDN